MKTNDSLFVKMILLILVVLPSCKSGSASKVDFTRISVSELNILSDDPFSNHISIDQYIRLETKKESLVGLIVKAEITDSQVLILSQDPGNQFNLLAFSTNGKFIRKFSNQGKGPGEVNDLSGYCVNDFARQIYLLDRGNKVIRYDFDGNLLSEFKCPDGAYSIICLDQEHLAFASSGQFLVYITDQKGREIQHFQNFDPVFATPTFSPLFKNGSEVLYKQYLNDTIYKLKSDDRLARYLIDYGKKALSLKQFAGAIPGPDFNRLIPDQLMSHTQYRGSTTDILSYTFSFNRKSYLAFSDFTGQHTCAFEWNKITNDPVLGKGFFAIGSTCPDHFIGIYMPAYIDQKRVSDLIHSDSPVNPDDNPILVLYRFNFKGAN